ncbi:MAG: M23 family metallopeptidase [Pseudomonadota bacterium]
MSAAFAASAMLIAAHPALANTTTSSSANAAAADMAEPLRDTSDSSLEIGDVRFRELFASWSSLDSAPPADNGVTAPVLERSVVSIPSLMPVEGARLTSGFGMRIHPVRGGRRPHKGVDLAAPVGTPVYATADGIVSLARSGRGYGLYIKVDHGAELETRYAHLSRMTVTVGERVEKGDVIGYVGSTGWSTGPHLHYEVRVDGVAVDPIPYMVEREREVQTSALRTISTPLQVSDSEESQDDMLPGRRRVGAEGSETEGS